MKIGILGYGNLGKGIEAAVRQNSDMELAGIFTKRNPETIIVGDGNSKVYSVGDLHNFKNEIDVLILCGGSATDLPKVTPEMVKDFNVVDSFDNHAKIPEHFQKVDEAARKGKKVGIISVGWDPGLFSINRLYGACVLPEGNDYTFWGKGVSQGHSDAVRRIPGVLDARQYTIPIDSAVERVRKGENPLLSTGEKHMRECFVVLEEGADSEKVEKEIKNMPNYFADYDTVVHFISKEEMGKNHGGIPHGGMVIRSGKTGMERENTNIIEYNLKLDSNPEFTSSVLLAYARACHRLFKEGRTGAMTVFDIPPSYLSPLTGEEIRKKFL